MADFPTSLPGFERRFPDEVACAEWLLERRWGPGFACPECGHDGYWRLGRKVLTLQCKACRRETSVTAGTGLHPRHPPLEGWVTPPPLGAPPRDGGSAPPPWAAPWPGRHQSARVL